LQPEANTALSNQETAMIDTARRRFLASSAIFGAAALTATKAIALSLETDNAEAEKLYLSACAAQNSYHQQLLAEVTAKLDGRPQQEIDAAVAALKCPFCGCPIAPSF
jgi:hypothetical protein